MRKRAYLVISLLIASSPMSNDAGGSRRAVAASRRAPRVDKAAEYETRRIEGWEVLVNKGLLQGQPDLAEQTLKLLGFQLYQITRVVPAEALGQLRTIRIWVEEDEPHHPCMAYHPDPKWLREHGMDTKKARCVEIANVRRFLEWTIEQPWMILHEMSHGYHHQFLVGGFANKEIKAAYSHAMKTGLYDRVLRSSGAEEKAYAAKDPMEYFAEASEAYFGTNDFFPFVRVELRRHDPLAFDTLERLWGVKQAVEKPTDRRTTTRLQGKSRKGR